METVMMLQWAMQQDNSLPGAICRRWKPYKGENCADSWVKLPHPRGKSYALQYAKLQSI
jgi:hypothetical protein